MIQINLLPVREAKRAADIRQQVMQLVLVLLLVAAGIGYFHSRITESVDSTRQRVLQMENDIAQFKPQLDQVAAFRRKKANLEKKIDVIDGLDRARSGPVRVMDELATHTPERLWLTDLSTSGTSITLKGESLDNELVAVFLRSLGDSPYFGSVDLESTQLGDSKEGGLKVVRFVIEAELVTPQTTEG